MTEDQAKFEIARLLMSGDGVQALFSRYLKANNLTTPEYDIQENFCRQQLMLVRLRCVVERDKDDVQRKLAKSARFAAAYGSKNFLWHRDWNNETPTMQNIMVRLRRFCRNTFGAEPKLALRSGKIVVDMRIIVPPPLGVD